MFCLKQHPSHEEKKIIIIDQTGGRKYRPSQKACCRGRDLLVGEGEDKKKTSV